jgi:hypothetical protein
MEFVRRPGTGTPVVGSFAFPASNRLQAAGLARNFEYKNMQIQFLFSWPWYAKTNGKNRVPLVIAQHCDIGHGLVYDINSRLCTIAFLKRNSNINRQPVLRSINPRAIAGCCNRKRPRQNFNVSCGKVWLNLHRIPVSLPVHSPVFNHIICQSLVCQIIDDGIPKRESVLKIRGGVLRARNIIRLRNDNYWYLGLRFLGLDFK